MQKKNIALVTGSTRGLGFEIIKLLNKKNCHTILTGRSEITIQKALTELNAHG